MRPEDLMTVVAAVPAAADVVLALNEALANVVDHAYPPDAPGTATLHAWIATDPRTAHRRGPGGDRRPVRRSWQPTRGHSDVASRRRDRRADAAQPLTGRDSQPARPHRGERTRVAGLFSCRR
ncbi:MAG: hypothetical protein ABS81_08275 [Pseudonocardia sp. SCN 72-86]|nr:MAG: hypothetical protein ABS81_08275 [Pseudonocardia sp. SCN 72-86]